MNPDARSSSSRRVARTIVVAAGLAAVIALGGACSSSGEAIADRMVERATGNEIDIDRRGDDGVTMRSEEGAITLGGTSIPDDWPRDVPLPDGLRDVYVTTMSSNEGEVYMALVAESSMSSEALDAFFTTGLSGWTETNRFSMESNGDALLNLSFESGNREVLVTIQDGEAGGLLSLTYLEH